MFIEVIISSLYTFFNTNYKSFYLFVQYLIKLNVITLKEVLSFITNGCKKNETYFKATLLLSEDLIEQTNDEQQKYNENKANNLLDEN